jgi:hypothetical protein
MIIGQDLQQAMSINILFSSQHLRWDKIEVSRLSENSNSMELDKISSLNKLNLKLRQITYLIPRSQNILISLNNFTYTMSINLNMSYYALRLRNCKKLYIL